MVKAMEFNTATVQSSDTDFHSLAAASRERLYRTALLLTGNVGRAGELVEETFAQAEAEPVRPAGDAGVGAWLSKILFQIYLDRYRDE